jgi:hypothetical protein
MTNRSFIGKYFYQTQSCVLETEYGDPESLMLDYSK